MDDLQLPSQFEFKGDSSGASGMMRFVVDWQNNVIRTTSSGFWSPRQVERHFEQFRACVQQMHANGTHASVIADLRDAKTQSQEVAETLRVAIAGLYCPGDRIAMVVTSSVAKMQLRRVLQSEYHEFFLSMDAAEKWLFAHRRAA